MEAKHLGAPEGTKEANLTEPVKVRWTGYTRNRIAEYMHDFDSDSSELVANTLNREKTNVVVNTGAEAHALLNELEGYDSDSRVWLDQNQENSINRVKAEIESELEARGHIELDDESNGQSRKPNSLCMDCPGCGKTHAVAKDSDTLFCLNCNERHTVKND